MFLLTCDIMTFRYWIIHPGFILTLFTYVSSHYDEWFFLYFIELFERTVGKLLIKRFIKSESFISSGSKETLLNFCKDDREWNIENWQLIRVAWYNSPNDGSYCIGTDLGSEDKWYKQLQLILQLQPGIFIPDDGGYCLNVITTDTGLSFP